MDHSKHEYNILPRAGSRLGSQQSEAARKKMSEAAKNRINGTAAANAACCKAVLVTNIETGETVEYVSQAAAAIALGVTPRAIRNCLKRKNLLKKTWQITQKSSD